MRVRASVLWVRLLLVCLGVTLTLPTWAFAVAYDISINTASLVGTSAPLAFDFIAGGASANTATVTGFTTDGGLGSALTTGAVSGALPGAVTLTTPGFFFNEYLSNLQLGTGFSFSLTTTVTGPSGLAFPDQFSFFLLNAGTGVPLFPTTDPTGAGALFALTLDGSPSGILSVYSGGPLSWTVSASPATSVPEPSTWLLLLPGIVGLWAWQRRLPLTSSSTTPLARAVRTYGRPVGHTMATDTRPHPPRPLVLVGCVLTLGALALSPIHDAAAQGVQDITAQVALTRSGLVLNRTTQTFNSTVTVTNTSATAFTTPQLVLTITPSTITVLNAAGVTGEGKPFFFLGTSSLSPGQTAPPVILQFQNPTNTFFTTAIQVLGVPVTAPVTVVVPNVVGQSQAAAASALTAAHLTVGAIASAHHATVPTGMIISQSPAAGVSVASGSAISVVVSSGPTSAGLPPNPADVAPPLDRTVATTVAAATAFLYTGANPIQTGVAPGTIALQRAAVLRGKVIDRAGLPLPGVVITILSHPEFGQTRSRADGMFDLVVNGGGLLTLRFATPGYISAQRQVSVPWQDWVVLEDTALVAYDPHTTLVDLSVLCDVNLFCRAQPMQVARGTPMTDADGARQATLLFQTGTTATLTLPGQPAQAMTNLTVRATEFTVGPNGPKAMPANLPPTSGYTYEVEFSVDEAEAAGATRISFSQPVLSYTENFLHFPVGTIVPYGEYDRTKGVWIPMPNGLVIQILSIAGGIATLDLTGSGQAADASALTALGIGTDERQNLAKLYTAGQTLWRVPLNSLLALQ